MRTIRKPKILNEEKKLSFRENLLNFDAVLVGLLLALSIISMFVIYSASGQNIEVVWKHAIRLFVGFTVMMTLSMLPLAFYNRIAPALYFFMLAVLVLVLLSGDIAKGAQRWLNLIVFKFQPSELLKAVIPLVLSVWLSKDHRSPLSFRTVSKALAALVAPVGLIALQPDLGTAILIGFSGMIVIYIAGLSKKHLALLLAVFVVSIPLIWHYGMLDYQKQRVLFFLQPENDPYGAGYHITQSKIAIGSGGLWGKGWLQGSQSQLGFLPEQSTDFAFAVLAEEFGFMGVCLLLFLFFMLTARGLYISLHASDHFGRLLAAGISLSFIVCALTNLAMVSGLLPVVGVPLPILSYGGTSTVSTFAVFGILISIQKYRPMMRKII